MCHNSIHAVCIEPLRITIIYCFLYTCDHCCYFSQQLRKRKPLRKMKHQLMNGLLHLSVLPKHPQFSLNQTLKMHRYQHQLSTLASVSGQQKSRNFSTVLRRLWMTCVVASAPSHQLKIILQTISVLNCYSLAIHC